METMEALPVKHSGLPASPSPSEQGFFDQLPDSMVEEILLRLPLSSVFRSRCVSQRCLSLTASPYFIQRFCRRNAPLNEDSPLFLLLQGRVVCTCRELSIRSRAPKINFSGFSLTFLPGVRHNGEDSPITVMGSCHDLLLCCNRDRDYFQTGYFVVNPMTRQWVALPPPLRRRHLVITGFVCDPASVPEARKGGKLRYRVACIAVDKLAKNIEIFSSEDGQWNEFPIPRGERLPEWTSRPVACNGILYWQVGLDGAQVMRLDPFTSEEKKIRLIPNPPLIMDEELEQYKLGMWQGKLRMCQVTWSDFGFAEPTHVKIWELEESEAGAEWRSVKVVCLQDIGDSGDSSYAELRKAAEGFGYGSIWPLAFHPDKEDVIYFGCKRMRKIICYDLKRVRLEIVSEFHLENTMSWPVDAYPIQQQCWPTHVPALPNL